MIRDPFLHTSHRIVDTPVSCLNIFQTIMDYAGEKAESDGFSLRPLMRGEMPDFDFAVSEWNRGAGRIPNIMIRTSDWKLMINSRDTSGRTDALYNLESDPYETRNLLYGEPSSKALQMRNVLTDKLVGYLKDRDYPYIDELERRCKQE